MPFIYILACIIVLFCFAYFLFGKEFEQHFYFRIAIIIFAGVAIRFLWMYSSNGHPNDLNNFKYWADSLFKDGFSNFYSSDVYTDYPPGYMYILYIVGMIKASLKLAYDSQNFDALIRLPAILFDIMAGLLIFKISLKKVKPNTGLFISLLYIFNLSTIFISSAWGQVDSIHTFFVIAMIYLFISDKSRLGMIFFVICIFIKPQTLVFSPILVYEGIRHFRRNGFSPSSIMKIFEYLLICILTAIVLFLPFCSITDGDLNFSYLFNQYINVYKQYQYVSLNAYNIYASFGLNLTPIDTAAPFLSYNIISIVCVSIIFISSIVYLYIKNNRQSYFFTAAFINLAVFMLSAKMHERNAFPVMILLLLAYLYEKRPKYIYLYVLASLAFFVNCYDVFKMAINGFNYDDVKSTAIYFSILYILTFIYMIYLFVDNLIRKKNHQPEQFLNEQNKKEIDKKDIDDNETIEYNPSFFQHSVVYEKLTGSDKKMMLVITLLYSVVALTNLGSFHAPQTYEIYQSNDEMIFEFSEETTISRIQYYLGVKPERKMEISTSADGENWIERQQFEMKSVFDWNEQAVNAPVKFIKLIAKSSEFHLMELGIRDDSDNLIIPKSINDNTDNLFDEQEIIPIQPTFMDGTYFDEVYHGRTAYEFINKLDVYEWTHPPLGKVIISIGVSLFGMTPFGWRICGTICGIIMLPFIYLFAKRMFAKTYWASIATALLALDFMHYTQTRIGTIDSYITFFVMLMYYFMYQYYQKSFYDTPLKKTLVPLFFSGLFMGIGIACKWPGMYAGLGLAVIFFICMYRRYREYQYAKEFNIKQISDKFYKNLFITLLCCIVFFIIIPIVIYLLSYIPYYLTESLYFNRSSIKFLNENPDIVKYFPDNRIVNYIASIIQNQFDMYNYHSKLVSEHSFSSMWWTWLFDIRPIFYYSLTISDTVKAGISSFGNPYIWWLGFVSVLYGIKNYKYDKSNVLKFLVIAYMAQLLPWVLITRTTYIYHYFPSIPFLILFTIYYMKDYLVKINKHIPILFICMCVIIFIMFYPVITGTPILIELVKKLKWFPVWQFIY